MVDAPPWFTFTPQEIRYISVINPGLKPGINEGRLREIWSGNAVQTHIGAINGQIHISNIDQDFLFKNPAFATPFLPNTKPKEGEEYARDGYLATFLNSLSELNIEAEQSADTFVRFCSRAGGTHFG